MTRSDPIRCRRDGCRASYRGVGNPTEALLHAQARAVGWRIGTRADGTPDAICPADARPDPELTQLCRELTASTQKGQST